MEQKSVFVEVIVGLMCTACSPAPLFGSKGEVSPALKVNGQERPDEFSQNHDGGNGTSAGNLNTAKTEGTATQPVLRCGGPNGIIRSCHEED